MFDENIIKVENAYKDITLYDENMKIIGHVMQDGDLKTEESYRSIPMTDRLKKMLLQLKEERKKEYIKKGRAWNEKEYVFLNSIGTPYAPERLSNKIKIIIRKYNLEHMTVYGFRHSFATAMSEKGMDREVLRELMGHSEFETTDFYYIHISEERKRKEFNRIHNQSPLGEIQGKEKKPESEKAQGKRYFVKKKTKNKRVLKLA